MTGKLEVRIRAYSNAAQQLIYANHTGASSYEALRDKLAGYGAMAGDDSTSHDFAQEYDTAAAEAMGGLKDLIDAAGNLAVILQATGRNHDQANRGSTYDPDLYTGDGTIPDGPVEVTAFTPPSSEGGDNEDLPHFWNLIQDHLEGFAWPNANTDRLREAANDWRSRGRYIRNTQTHIAKAMNYLEELKSPEIPIAVSALLELRGAIGDIADSFNDQADACEAYAEEVDAKREIVKGIMKDLAIEAGLSIAGGIVLSFFSGGIAAGGATAVAGWRITKAARRIIETFHALKAAAKARAVAKLTAVTARVRPLRTKLLRFAKGRKVEAVPKRPVRVKGKLPKKGEPGSYGYDDKGDLMPYANSRPGYDKNQVEDVWNKAKDENGEVWVRDKDDNLVKIDWEPGQPRNGAWDMGHVEGREYRDLLDEYLSHRISKEEFLKEYRNVDNYTVQHVGRNRSHMDEAS